MKVSDAAATVDAWVRTHREHVALWAPLDPDVPARVEITGPELQCIERLIDHAHVTGLLAEMLS